MFGCDAIVWSWNGFFATKIKPSPRFGKEIEVSCQNPFTLYKVLT